MVKVKSSSTKVSEDKGRKKEKVSKVVKVVKATKIKAEMLISTVDDKQKIIDKFGQKKGDTGSPEVQAALLSLKIDKLAEHLEINKKDNHSRRGLLKVIAKRRRILNYLEKLDEKRYKKLIKEIGLKK
jgi:small subunit ribosomal protein S15